MSWPGLTNTSGSSNVTWTSTSTAVTLPVTYYASGSSAPALRPKTALEWLDDETEAVCKLARQAG